MMGRSMIQFIAGANAGAISRTLTAPLERIKIIIQAKDPGKRASMRQEMKNIRRESGFKGFFKGNGANVFKMIPETALHFLFYEYFKGIIAYDGIHLSNLEYFSAATISGFISHSICYPLEIIKTRLTIAQEGVYRGLMDCMLTISRTEGLRALYKGWGVSVFGMVPNIAFDFAIFNIMRDWYSTNYERRPSIPHLLAFGSFSSLSGQLVAYPFNLMRTRLQAQGLPNQPILYNGLVDCARQTYRKDGFKGFYKGSLPNFTRNVPAVAISYVAFERILTMMEKIF